MKVRTWDSLPEPNFVKSIKGVYSFLANVYQKITISAILGVVSPHFKSDRCEIWPEATDSEYAPPGLILKKNRLRGYTPFGHVFTKNYKFQQFLRCKPTF